ncbi:hypothetical protein AGABI1DRAFT_132583 [Agaricus bisporus var. burnettii JB137-S8]|uniref:Uncharacterized protein n=1 Tax=Agaricus bisporus var. burnettii (strain JB137-S8 / ATCC MYA-4627 / FGSC 10392) TaxID=597362 RepID=K5VL88_AGABU|nr:uncharacterized protein AGABI1DRAFT_132583 [Agaricus bisporus var. burnettii JB137-S8]EKM75134.1 hypothetical protein AGABI1DRAFT_132583 [Agaricus bisporus var. burnettii JB137-S8]
MSSSVTLHSENAHIGASSTLSSASLRNPHWFTSSFLCSSQQQFQSTARVNTANVFNGSRKRSERKKDREGSGGGGEERRHKGRTHFPFFFCAIKRTHARLTGWSFVSKKAEEPSDQAKRSCTALQFKIEETRLGPFDILGEEGKGKKDDRKANATIESEEEDGDHGSRWRSRCRFKQQGLRPNKGHNADDDKESTDPEATKVKDGQHKLHKTFLSSKGIPEDECPPSTICSPQREL